MCGIAGFSLSPDEATDSLAITKAMLLSIESRGKDATGVAFGDLNGTVWHQKSDDRASVFVKTMDRDLGSARRVIMHTRFATQGSPKRNVNNHPIVLPGIVGVHNGCLYNDDDLFRMLGAQRCGEVDSEAIFALLGDGRDVFDDNRPCDLLGLVEGSAAIAWLNVGDRATLHCARISSSPLIIARTKNGSFLFASTEGAIRAGISAGKMELDFMVASIEGAHYRIRNGQIEAMRVFEPPVAQPRKRYSYKPALPASARSYTYGKGWVDARTEPEITFTDDDDNVYDFAAYDDWRQGRV